MEDLQLFTTIRYDAELLNVPKQGFVNVGWNQNPSLFYMLDLHRDRMLKAASHWGWEAAVRTLHGDDGLRVLEAFLQTNVAKVVDGPHRVKILIDREGTLSVIKAPTKPVHLNNLFPSSIPKPSHYVNSSSDFDKIPVQDPVYEIVLDKQTTAESPFTYFKTTHRPMYDEARHRANIGSTDEREVLLVNENDGSIMEGSITTPYFWRNGRWVTPPVSSEFNVTKGNGGNNGTTRRAHADLDRNLVAEEVVQADSLLDGEECWISNGLKGFVSGRVRLL
ncbi:aminotransferase [Xylariaceae sp. FL1651]|nr:aminotransferase [Xylariaceae sp. FL1651]